MRQRSITALCLLFLGAIPAVAGWDEGVAAFTSKNYQKAAAEFQKLVDQNPDGYRGHYMLGLSLEQLKRKEEAVSHLRKAYDLNPNDLGIKVALGRAYFNVRRYGDVTKLLGSVDASSLPSRQQAAFYQIRGQSKLKTSDPSGAAADFEKLVRIRPDDARVQYMYGTTALSIGQLEQGLAALSKASLLAPDDLGMRRAHAQALIRKGRMTRDKAAKRQAYSKASQLAAALVAKDASYDNLILKVSAELGAGDYSAAVLTGEAALAKKGSDWLAYYYLGQAYTSNGQYKDAEAPLKQALSLAAKPTDEKLVWRQLGFAYEKQKKYAQSVDAYQNAADHGSVARVKENESTDRYNQGIEAENREIERMAEEAKKLEEELKALEAGGGGR